MEDSIKVIKKDPKIQKKLNIMLDRYMSLPYDFRSKIGYNSLIQIVILKELKNIMSLLIIDLNIELKMKISRRKNLEDRLMYNK